MATEGTGKEKQDSLSAQLALDRTRLAHDRTLMAWVRTATSLISFGFTIYKFFQYLHEKGEASPERYLIGPREFALTNKHKINLYNFTRYEYRRTKDRATDQWTTVHRIRSRFGAEIPLTSLEKAWKPKTFYGIGDVEPFFRSDKKALDPFRLRAGLGYVANDRLRVEFIYHAQFGRATTDDPLEYNQNIFRLNFKLGLHQGILDRNQNPGVDE
jgi:uncharacterized protein DUF2490/uncharacterized protein DUF202